MRSPFSYTDTQTPSVLSSAKFVLCAQRKPYNTEIQNRLDEAAMPCLPCDFGCADRSQAVALGTELTLTHLLSAQQNITLRSMALLYALSGRQEKRDLENGGGERQTQLLVTWEENRHKQMSPISQDSVCLPYTMHLTPRFHSPHTSRQGSHLRGGG